MRKLTEFETFQILDPQNKALREAAIRRAAAAGGFDPESKSDRETLFGLLAFCFSPPKKKSTGAPVQWKGARLERLHRHLAKLTSDGAKPATVGELARMLKKLFPADYKTTSEPAALARQLRNLIKRGNKSEQT